jgi:hypothetical protein
VTADTAQISSARLSGRSSQLNRRLCCHQKHLRVFDSQSAIRPVDAIEHAESQQLPNGRPPFPNENSGCQTLFGANVRLREI